VAGMGDADRPVAVGGRPEHDPAGRFLDPGQLRVGKRNLGRGGDILRPPVGGPGLNDDPLEVAGRVELHLGGEDLDRDRVEGERRRGGDEERHQKKGSGVFLQTRSQPSVPR